MPQVVRHCHGVLRVPCPNPDELSHLELTHLRIHSRSSHPFSTITRAMAISTGRSVPGWMSMYIPPWLSA